MTPQISVDPASFAGFVLFVLLIFAATPAVMAAQPGANDTLREAVAALGEENYEEGLELLQSIDGSERDPRVSYYRGFALEKLGQCREAADAYLRASGSESKKLRSYATDALDGFGARCVPAETPDVEAVEEVEELPRGSGRVGWKIFGWTTTVLGALALVAVPVKGSIEQDGFDQAKPYFQERYGCDVEPDSVSGDQCNESALLKDPAYDEYRTRADTARETTNYLLIGGVGLAGIGVGTLLSVAFTRPSVDVAFSPSSDGAHVSAAFRF